jgi:hypothetical protein
MNKTTIIFAVLIILGLTLLCGALVMGNMGKANVAERPTMTPTPIIVTRQVSRPSAFGTVVPGSGGLIQYRIEKLK